MSFEINISSKQQICQVCGKLIPLSSPYITGNAIVRGFKVPFTACMPCAEGKRRRDEASNKALGKALAGRPE